MKNNKKKEALVTICIGEQYKKFYDKYFRPSQERFAKKIGVDLFVIDDYIDKSMFGKDRHPAWQKLLIFKSPLTQKYERLCWIDADIFITKHSKNPFNIVGDGQWGAAINNPYQFDDLAKTDLVLYEQCPKPNRPDYLLNTGVFIVGKKEHGPLLESIYKNNSEQICYENGPLSYTLLNTPNGKELESSFNCAESNYFRAHKTDGKVERIIGLVRDNDFIHFCGGINKKILKLTILVDRLGIVLISRKWIQFSRLIKRVMPKPLMLMRRNIVGWFKTSSTSVERKLRKYHRVYKPVVTEGYIFAVLCVKKNVYADMVIENINSLHYLNPNHKVIIYCDTQCAQHLNQKKGKFNYLKNVVIQDNYGVADKPWQYYKIETLIDASKHNMILNDADSIWHDDPLFDKEKITLLVAANKIIENENEILLVEKLFMQADWVEFYHYVTGFVYIPSCFMTDKLAQDMRDYNDAIFCSSLNFIDDASAKNGLRRLSEELSINLALQSNFPTEIIVTLKKEDGPGNQQSLQSLYYGCCNNVNE
jgi:hypothetical protein